MAKTKIEAPAEVVQFLRSIAQVGGFRTAQARTPEQRSAAARKASHARWGIDRKSA